MNPALHPTGATESSRAALSFRLLVLVVAVAPYLPRLAHPSLYADDVVRVSFVRNLPLGQRLLLPFNEHLAPLFELVTTATWACAGFQLTHAPLAFTTASFVPFLAVLWLLGGIVSRETGSAVTGNLAVVFAAFVPLHAEVVGWYSASSFTWALLCTLAGYRFSMSPARLAPGAALLAAAAAPAFCGIGLLAGPVAALRFLVEKRWKASVLPLLGTALYLFFALALKQHRAWSMPGAPHSWRPALEAIIRAPVGVLLLGVTRLRDAGVRRFNPLDLIGFSGFLIAVAGLALRSRHARSRGLIVAGAALILGGYSLTLGVRAGLNQPNPLPIQRYQLFPLIGLVFLLAPSVAALAARMRIDSSHVRSLVLLGLVALVLSFVHAPRFKAYRRFYNFRDQPEILRTIARLEDTAKTRGEDRETLLRELPQLRPHWFDHESLSVWMLVGPIDSSESGTPDKSVAVERTRLDSGIMR